jgi:LemA protein
MGWIVLGALVLVSVYAIGIYNALVGLRNRSESSWSDIDVQLERRHELIPNLVETVKGYAGHERATLEGVVAACGRAMQASGAEARGAAENGLTRALRQLFALGRGLPGAPGQPELPGAAARARKHRGRDPERPALLQRETPARKGSTRASS